MPSRKQRRHRGGQPTPETPSRPALPGSIALGLPPPMPRGFMPPPPEGPPRLVRSPAAVYPPSSSTARRLDFTTGPGCVPIYKRLPGHAPDQCEASDHADAMDRIMCMQPGQGQVQSLDDCGPIPRRGGKHKRKTRKTKKLKRKHRKV